jgi:hypothetical protein
VSMFESPTPNESRIDVDQEEFALIGFLTETSGALLGEPMSELSAFSHSLGQSRHFDRAQLTSGLPRLADMQFFDLKLPGTDDRRLAFGYPGCYSRRAVAKRFPGYSQRRFCILIHKSPAPARSVPEPQ